jgi:hypothetical protein
MPFDQTRSTSNVVTTGEFVRYPPRKLYTNKSGKDNGFLIFEIAMIKNA